MQLEFRVPCFHRPEQILVPLNRQIRIVAALQQELVAADGNRLVDLPEDLLETEDVPFAVANLTIERAEVAARHAHIRVIDVAVDDVGDDAIRMFAGTDAIGKRAKQMRRRMPIEGERLRRVYAAAVPDL